MSDIPRETREIKEVKHECKCRKSTQVKTEEKYPSLSKKLVSADSFRVEVLMENGKGTIKAQHKFADMEELVSFGFFATEECLKKVFEAFFASREDVKKRVEENGKKEEMDILLATKEAIDKKIKELNGGK